MVQPFSHFFAMDLYQEALLKWYFLYL